jgi:hypothetical protein
MTQPQHPADLVRQGMKQMLSDEHVPRANFETDDALKQFIVAGLAPAIDELAGHPEIDWHPREGTETLVAVFAATLLSFGELTMAEHLRAYQAAAHGSRDFVRWALRLLLPLPPELKKELDTRRVGHWLLAHRHELFWDEESGLFRQKPGDSACGPSPTIPART